LKIKKKHIGIVVTKPPVYSEQFLKDKISGLLQSGYQVTVLSNAHIPHQKEYKIVYALSSQPILSILKSLLYNILRGLWFLPILFRYYRISRGEGNSWRKTGKYLISNYHILTQKIDWLHFEFSGLAYNREYVAKAIGCKMSLSIRGYDIAISPLKNSKVHSQVWKFTDKVHSISDDITHLAYQQGMPHNMQVNKIYPAIDTHSFSLKKNIGSISNPLKIVSVGRLHWKKGYNYTLLALKELKNNHIEFDYTIIGAGKAKEELIYIANLLELQNEINFVGEIQHSQIPTYLKQSDIFIQFSVQEGFSNAVLEAQSCGLLVVASDAEGLQENIIHNETGWIVKRRDFKGLYKQLNEIIMLPAEIRKQIAIHASERVKTDFDISLQNKLFDEFFA